MLQPVVMLMFSLCVFAGDAGDNFYVIDEGTFDVYIKKEGVETKVTKSLYQGIVLGQSP